MSYPICQKCGGPVQMDTGGNFYCPRCSLSVKSETPPTVDVQMSLKLQAQVINLWKKEVASALADIYAALIRVIHCINSLPAPDEGDVSMLRIDRTLEARITDGLSRWTSRAIGGKENGSKMSDKEM